MIAPSPDIDIVKVIQYLFQAGILGVLYKFGKILLEVRDNFRDVYNAIVGTKLQDGIITRLTRLEQKVEELTRDKE